MRTMGGSRMIVDLSDFSTADILAMLKWHYDKGEEEE